MGQGQSAVPLEARSHEQLVKELANRFAEKCFSPLELYSLKDNFRSLADRQQDLRYLKEDTVARFLEIPDILHASPVVFHMVSCLGAFPFLADAPAVLGLEQLVIVVTLLTDRYRRVLAHGASDRRTLLFRSLAVHDRTLFPDPDKTAQGQKEAAAAGTAGTAVVRGSSRGFAIDAAVDDEGDDDADGEADDDDDNDDDNDDDHDDDDLVLAALSSLDYTSPRPRAATSRTSRPKNSALHDARIPADNFRKLVLLLLLVAPLAPQEQLSQHADRVAGRALDSLRATAECVLATFLDVETSPGIRFPHFDAIVPVCFPHLFGGFNALFERFLFSKNLDFSKVKPATTGDGGRVAAQPAQPPLLLRDADDTILDLNVLSQLSFFLPGSSLFHRLRLLYSGDNDGFSMGSFESRVFNWRAPTILLVQGTRVGTVPRGGQEAAFAAALPPRRLPVGSARGAADGDGERVVFGAYVSQPWRLTTRECFGDSDCVLFQLAPVHDVFGASTLNRDYAAFVKPTAANQHAGGIAFGCPPPSGAAAKAMQKQKQPSPQAQQHAWMAQGPLSLLVDASFEFGVMNHAGAGGAFHGSAARLFDFQERFAIDALEVWGCGGDGEAKAQAERWAWEAREAEARRRINLGTGDVEADRQLLEMAGLIGQNRSGGSMA